MAQVYAHPERPDFQTAPLPELSPTRPFDLCSPLHPPLTNGMVRRRLILGGYKESEEASYEPVQHWYRSGQDSVSSCWSEPVRRSDRAEEVFSYATSSFHCERASWPDREGSLRRVPFPWQGFARTGHEVRLMGRHEEGARRC